MKSIAEKSFEITSLFEAEVFVQLMLWRWRHPLADDQEFANGLLETASSALQDAIQGQELIEGLPPADFNFVAAVWYAESCAVDFHDVNPDTLPARKAWLDAVRRALPSCFCDPSDLG
jgi:hypothetical protein